MAGIAVCDHADHGSGDDQKWVQAVARVKLWKSKTTSTAETSTILDACDEHLMSIVAGLWAAAHNDLRFDHISVTHINNKKKES